MCASGNGSQSRLKHTLGLTAGTRCLLNQLSNGKGGRLAREKHRRERCHSPGPRSERAASENPTCVGKWPALTRWRARAPVGRPKRGQRPRGGRERRSTRCGDPPSCQEY
eukprot:scaffold32835_cov61-Phaeocystis_antarctica.AAC.2